MQLRKPRRLFLWSGLVVLPAVLNVLLLGASVAKASRIKTHARSMSSVSSISECAAESAICRGGETPAIQASIVE